MSRFVPARIDEWAYWIVAREALRKGRESGKPPPWTKDKTMAETRWCNVRRMDDKVSKWMLDHWFRDDGYAEARTALIAGLMARMINKPETLAAITAGNRFAKWDHDRAYKAMYEIKNRNETVFTSAYIINGASGGPKIDQVLSAIDTCYKGCDKHAGRFIAQASMQETATRLHALRGVGSFIAGQVVADLRWVLGDTNAGWWADRMTWAPPGPGSSRGMKYLLGKASAEDMAGRGADLSEKEFLPALRELVLLAKEHPTVGPIFAERGLEAHDIQNTLCETSKFIRIKYATGRAKNKYDAATQFHEGRLL
jgi:hypothetical protein